jgi:hypothetical protein
MRGSLILWTFSEITHQHWQRGNVVGGDKKITKFYTTYFEGISKLVENSLGFTQRTIVTFARE